MLDVVIRAPLLSYSGYGEHSRQIFKWLTTRSDWNIITQIVQWGSTTWMVNPDMENGLVGDIMSRSNDEKKIHDVSFQVQLPDEWDLSLAKFNIGVTALVETDKCNPDWIENINNMDLVIVPSNHVKQTILNTGSPTTPICVIPESYLDDIDNPDLDAIDLGIDTKFNFLIVGTFTGSDPYNDRKNLFFTIKWLCETFKNDPDVGIIVKTNHGRGTIIDRSITKGKIKQVRDEVRKGEYPKIHMLHGNLTSSEMAAVYRNDIKCFVSLTRGEGYGLPLLESAASGIPIIATNWSGHLDFLRLGKFIPVHYKMVDVPDSRVDGRIFTTGTQWADPLESDFKKKVKKFRNSYEKPMAWASDLSTKIKENFSHSSVCKIYDSVIEEHLVIKK